MKKNIFSDVKKYLILLIILPIMLFFSGCDKNSISAFDIAVKNGFVGTEQEWLNSLQGKSAYDIAVENGFIGTEQEWLNSLQGKNGNNGTNSTSINTYEIYLEAKNNEEISSEVTYLEFLKNYFSTSYDYTQALLTKNTMSVVSVYSYLNENSKSSSSSGSGVIYSLDSEGNAYIITNYHVTCDSSSRNYGYFKLYLFNQTTPISASYVGGSRIYDIAILKVNRSNILLESNAQTVSFRDYDAIVGEICYAIGDTNEAGITITKGIVSIESEKFKMSVGGISSYYRGIRHDAYIGHGNSGGGLFDSNGNLIGITNGGVDGTLMNYAYPANVVKELTKKIIEECSNNSSTHIKIHKIGIENNLSSSDTLTIYDSSTSKIITKETVVIDYIEENTLISSEGNLKSNDEIISITYNGKKYENIKTYTLNNLLISSQNGDVIIISAKRKTIDEQSNEVISEETITSTITLSFASEYELQ